MTLPATAQEIYLDAGGTDRAFALAVSQNRILIGGTTDADAPDRLSGVYYVLDARGEFMAGHRVAGPTRTWVFDALPTPGGFFLSAWTNNAGTADDETYYALDRDGNPLVSNRYGEPDEDEQVRTLIPLPDNRALALGNLGTDDRAVATVLDATDGSIIWKRTLRYPDARFNIFTDAVMGPGGDLYLVGVSILHDEATQTFMTRVRPDGELVATYRYISPWERGGGSTRTILALPDGRLLVSVPFGAFTRPSRSSAVYTLSPQGDVLAGIELVSAGPVTIRDALLTPDSTYLLVGTLAAPERDYGLLLELDYAGNILRQRNLGARAGTQLTAIRPAPEGGFWLAGTIEDCEGEDPQTDLLLIRLDENLQYPDTCELQGAPIVRSLPQLFPAKNDSLQPWAAFSVPTAAPVTVRAEVAEVNPYQCPATVAASAPAPFSTCAGEQVEVDLTTPGVSTYLWSDGMAGPVRAITAPADLTINLGYDCQSVELPVTVEALACCRVYLPTAFSPDGDGVNDVFQPAFGRVGCQGVRAYELMIFDRWGGLVFTSSDPDLGWDGGDYSSGVFAYALRYFDGVTERDKSGVFSLLR